MSFRAQPRNLFASATKDFSLRSSFAPVEMTLARTYERGLMRSDQTTRSPNRFLCKSNTSSTRCKSFFPRVRGLGALQRLLPTRLFDWGPSVGARPDLRLAGQSPRFGLRFGALFSRRRSACFAPGGRSTLWRERGGLAPSGSATCERPCSARSRPSRLDPQRSQRAGQL